MDQQQPIGIPIELIRHPNESVIPAVVTTAGGAVLRVIVCDAMASGLECEKLMPKWIRLSVLHGGKRIGWAEYRLDKHLIEPPAEEAQPNKIVVPSQED
jgi:hypothetical protein